MLQTIKIGDTVQWQGGWGVHDAKPAVVEGMEVTEEPREKYDGEEVEEVSFGLVRENRVLFSLATGKDKTIKHWAYSDQILLPS